MKRFLALSSTLMLVCALLVPTSVFATHKKSCITLYEHINYKGRSIKLCSNDNTLVNNDWNDLASSAKVSAGHGVTLFEHINYKGAKWHLKGGHNYPDFRNRDLGSGNWNDVVSSVQIR
ncbi:Beta/Gamma crystallin [Seinonella peptonophila]|uniref:Beta/Gamma crystallin n=1 Tax=Seinonella peptonophila TaxID=112248 RepID=A0A1M4ZSR7_9BACL|nr:peptidase inhibitor family I36 protein [Seinonella peptonophila]SHF20847.1 Beta/Gamma crystallin [Seinonella peptonophila]